MHASPCLTRYRVNPNERWCWCGELTLMRDDVDVVVIWQMSCPAIQSYRVSWGTDELHSVEQFRVQVPSCSLKLNGSNTFYLDWACPAPGVACQYSSRDANQEDIEATAHVAEMLLHWNRRKGKSFETNVLSSDPLVLCLWQCCVLIICHLWPGSLV